jgi:hypothetical protein
VTARRLPVLLMVAVLAMAFPAAAVAKKSPKLGPVFTVSQTQSVPIHTRVAAVATCPNHTTLVGGGFLSTPTFVALGGSNFVTESHRSGTNGWVASAADANSSTTGAIRVEAYCRKGAKPMTEVSTPSSLAASASPSGPFTTGSAIATCPSGRLAAGGFSSDAQIVSSRFQGALVYGSFPASTSQWHVDALNSATATAGYTAYAYCSSAQRKSVSASTSFSGTNAPAAVDSPQCPKAKVRKSRKRRRTSALAGGFQGNLNINTPPFGGPFVSESRRNNGLWHVGGTSVGTGSGTLTAFGLCG